MKDSYATLKAVPALTVLNTCSMMELSMECHCRQCVSNTSFGVQL